MSKPKPREKMKNSKTFMLLAFVLCVFSGSTVSAGTTVVGFELGVSTRASIQTELGKNNLEIEEGEELVFAHGRSVVVRGAAFGISGLIETCFAFDKEDKLGFIGLLMDPARFEAMDKILENKYSFLERHAQENGSRCSHYASDDAFIDLIHDTGTPLQLLYVRKDVRESADKVAKEKAEEAAKKEAENF